MFLLRVYRLNRPCDRHHHSAGCHVFCPTFDDLLTIAEPVDCWWNIAIPYVIRLVRQRWLWAATPISCSLSSETFSGDRDK
jgi:hypothetical protein